MIKIEDLKDVKTLQEIEGLEIKQYVPIREKELMIEALVDILVRKDENGMYVINCIEKEVKAKVAMISLYTNIEITEDDYLNYDILMKNELLYMIWDYTDVDNFFCMLDDRIENKLNENSIERVASEKMSDIVKIVDNTMSHVNDMLDKGDPNKIAKYLSKGIEMIADKLPDFSKLDVTKPIKEQMK